ncbi:MAG: hypothetical protein HY289_13090 [Planctomycetes bacterium]|nr:hypothetical protein [Planctomycetota bacterium]
MSRFLSLFAVLVIVVASVGSPPDDPKFNNVVSVQAAMARARTLLIENEAGKAVDVLEEQLVKVNGNPQYLALLREAYRAYIRDLYLAGRPDTARRYLERLVILEPAAANDPALKPAVDAPPHKFVREPVAPPKKQALPAWKLPDLFAKKEEPKTTEAPKATIRLLGDGAATEDPFDRKNERAMPVAAVNKSAQAREHLTRGADEFKLKRYPAARVCFEQAYQADPNTLDLCREQWAYCIMAKVVDAMDQPGALPAQGPMLQKEIEAAIQMAPTKMLATGQKLLQAIEARAGLPLGGTSKVRHIGANKEGWQVTKTQYFLIFHKQDNDFAERVAKIAESTRTTMYRKWFMSEGVDWEPVCELILHPTSAEYTHMTGVPGESPGHSRIECDAMGRVISRRLDLRQDASGMMEAVLPHETTHVVLAGMFGSAHVPRWADEGIAVLSEPNEKVEHHRRNLLKHHKDGQLFGLKELMELKDYPPPRRVGAFYAQSVVLVEFLTQQRGAKVFTDFVKDGIRQGYDMALQRHYNMTFTQLDQTWQRQVIGNPVRLTGSK